MAGALLIYGVYRYVKLLFVVVMLICWCCCANDKSMTSASQLMMMCYRCTHQCSDSEAAKMKCTGACWNHTVNRHGSTPISLYLSLPLRLSYSMSLSVCLSVCVSRCVSVKNFIESDELTVFEKSQTERESWATAKMTARCALCMCALKIFDSPWVRPRLVFPNFLGLLCSCL